MTSLLFRKLNSVCQLPEFTHLKRVKAQDGEWQQRRAPIKCHKQVVAISAVPFGLVVRIPGFHPGGPGSIPGVGSYSFFFFHIVASFMLLFSCYAIGQLVVLLLPCKKHTDREQGKIDIQTSLIQAHELVGTGEIFITPVAKKKPITRKQYEEANSYWPAHFHEDKR